LIPWLLAWRTDDFGGTGHAAFVAVTCLFAILVSLCLLPLGAGGRPARGGVFAGWLIAGYAILATLPWPRHVLNFGVPNRGTIALRGIGLTLALVVAAGALRLRGDETVSDTVS